MSKIVPLIAGQVPIPIAQREGFGIHEGSRLIASLYDIRHYNAIAEKANESSGPPNRRSAPGDKSARNQDAVLGGILLAPVRKTVLAKVLKLTLAFRNEVGALRSVTRLIAEHRGNILFHQGAGNGVTHCHVYFPDANEARFLVSMCRLMRQDDAKLSRMQVTLPMNIDIVHRDGRSEVRVGDENPPKNKIRRVCTKLSRIMGGRFMYAERLGVIENVVRACIETERGLHEEGLGVAKDELYVQGTGIPFPRGLYERLVRYQGVSVAGAPCPIDANDLKVVLPNGVLLTEVRDEMALTCLVPRRDMIRVSVRTRTFAASPGDRPGVGVADRILSTLERSGINVLYTDVHSAELRYRGISEAAGGADSKNRPLLYGERGILDFIGAMPRDWAQGRPEALARNMETLEDQLKGLSLAPALEPNAYEDMFERVKGALGAEVMPNRPQQGAKCGSEEIKSALVEWAELIAANYAKLEAKNAAELLRDLMGMLAKLGDTRMWPSPEVSVSASPTTRCFLARTGSPEPKERQFIDCLRPVLDECFFRVEEGMVSLGQTIDKITRGRIKSCDVLISVIWPRARREDEGPGAHYLDASDWLIHEESYAMGAGIPVFRFREKRAAAPAYQRDQVEFLFSGRDVAGWDAVFQDARAQFNEFLIDRVMRAGSMAEGGVAFS